MATLSSKRKLPSWMREAKAVKTTPSSGIAKVIDEEYGLSKLSFPGKISYCYNKDECNFICEQIINESSSKDVVLGFDIEWKVTYVKGDYRKTAVLQLCPDAKICYIFHLVHMDGFPSELCRLLQHEGILKVGVGIQGDMNRLNNDYGINASGIVDLATIANEKIGNYENWSLNGLLKNQLQLQISKENSVRCSNWEAIPLTHYQLMYAALDAYAGILIYAKLHST